MRLYPVLLLILHSSMPEIKFYAMRMKVDKNMETSVSNLFAAGDGAGLSRDIVNAAATGMLAARGILNRL